MFALVAAGAFHDLRFFELGGVDAEGAHFALQHFDGVFATLANFSHETLSDDGADGGRNEERLHADIDETSDGTGRVVRVERGENEMAGERGVDGDVRAPVFLFSSTGGL